MIILDSNKLAKATSENALHYKYELYLDFFNNFLTVERFAKYYHFSEETACAILEDGRLYSNRYN